MTSRRFSILCWIAILFGFVARSASCAEPLAPGWKAGTAKAVITPKKPIWMAGYGSRTAPAEGALHDLWIRAVALEDAEGHRAVILASDTLGFPRAMYDAACDRLKQRLGLDRSQIMLNASHTHCGPVLQGALYDTYPLTEEHRREIQEYSDGLIGQVVETIVKAFAELEPATLSHGLGHCDFAVNRRTNREPDVPLLREQNLLMGPVDHSVPILAVHRADGTLQAVVFIYACHNTTLSFQQWCGDYAGFAQDELEKKHPGAMALFTMGCGGDQNPLPRRTVELCQEYGSRLAASVERELSTGLKPLQPRLQTRFVSVPLELGPLPNVSGLQALASESPSYSQRWAKRLLEEIRNGVPHPREYPYPVQAWRLDDQLWVTLGGEVVVDLGLHIKAELGERTWVSAYANDVMAYIPSKRVLLEGGYEGQSSMMVYGMPAERWAGDVEERVVQGALSAAGSLAP